MRFTSENQPTQRLPDGCRPWSATELATLERDYERLGAREIALTLGRSHGAVQRKAESLGIPGRRGRPRVLTEPQELALCEWYRSYMTLAEKAAELGISPACLVKILKRRGVFRQRKGVRK